jgi:hypothetical protein
MSKHLCPNPYANVIELMNEFGIILPTPHKDWRLLPDAMVGEINGLVNLRGMAVATNGILVAITPGRGIVLGHLSSFVCDEDESNPFDQEVSEVDTDNEVKYRDVDLFKDFVM